MAVVQQAAALLDEELAAGIVAAKKVQRSVRTKHRVDPSDFREALDKFQSDGHELVGVLGEQLQRPRSKETDELIQRFVGHTQDILDVMVELVNTGALQQSRGRQHYRHDRCQRKDHLNRQVCYGFP